MTSPAEYWKHCDCDSCIRLRKNVAAVPAKKSPAAEAAKTVAERGKVYGHPRVDYTRTAALWTVILGDRLTTPLTPTDAIQMMRLMKESRLAQTPDHYDSLLDICGYAECHYMCLEKADPRQPELPLQPSAKPPAAPNVIKHSPYQPIPDNRPSMDSIYDDYAAEPTPYTPKQGEAVAYDSKLWRPFSNGGSIRELLTPGTEVRVKDDVRTWVVEEMLTPDGGCYRMRCTVGNAPGFRPMKVFYVDEIVLVAK